MFSGFQSVSCPGTSLRAGRYLLHDPVQDERSQGSRLFCHLELLSDLPAMHPLLLHLQYP